MRRAADEELVQRYGGGDAEAFAELFERYHVPVYNFARSILGDSGAPDEVLQEVFLTLARSPASYGGRAPFRAWLMRVVRNRCLNRLTADRRRGSPVPLGSAAASDLPDRSEGPDRVAAANETHGRLRTAIDALPPHQRQALTLYAFEQMSYREIAQAMEMPVNTVKTHIHRARAVLAQQLGETP